MGTKEEAQGRLGRERRLVEGILVEGEVRGELAPFVFLS